jgi:hypothetical protein
MLPETIQKYSIHAAQSFIQTVVFVDDRIYEGATRTSDEPRKVIAPKIRTKASRTAVKGAELDALSSVDVNDENASPDSYDIVTSFAKKQIVCSLYQPKKTAKVSPASDVFPLCKSADVVIVDWDLFGDKGQRALELIDGLIAQAVRDVPEQLRLILVYTQELNLFGVANELYERVHASIGEDFRPVEEEGGLAFVTENSRVVVFGKPGRERANTDPEHIVEESSLADVAVREFAKLAAGLLQAAALLGLAEIRKNSRKVLSKFSADLDPAFLTHLAMCMPEEDASSHIVPLLISEIEAVLEDALPNPLISEQLLKDWCQNVWSPGEHLRETFGDADLRALGETILTEGFAGAREKNNNIAKLGSNASTRKASRTFLNQEDSTANHMFAHLMSSRTFYNQAKRVLKLGVLVHQVREGRYLLCLQPVCDSVRINGARVFLFAQLYAKDGLAEGPVTHVATKPNGELLELLFQPKAHSCVALTFSSTQGHDVVLARDEGDGGYAFYDDCGYRYEWLDQLKTSHAQRAATSLAGDISRVGLSESEWLRRLER